MQLKEALQKEVEHLDDAIRQSLEMADRRNDFMIGRQYRFFAKQMKESYQRVIQDLD